MGEDGQPLPYLDEIYYQILPDDAAKVANLQSGNVDGIDLQSSSNSTITCMANADLSTYQHHYNINFWAGFNFGNEMLAKLEVRQAIAYAIDRQEIVDVVFEGLATTTPFFSARISTGITITPASMNTIPKKRRSCLRRPATRMVSPFRFPASPASLTTPFFSSCSRR